MNRKSRDRGSRFRFDRQRVLRSRATIHTPTLDVFGDDYIFLIVTYRGIHFDVICMCRFNVNSFVFGVKRARTIRIYYCNYVRTVDSLDFTIKGPVLLTVDLTSWKISSC